MILDLQKLIPPGRPNWHLVVPNGWAHPHALGRAPRFDVSLDVLREALVGVVAEEPRCHIVGMEKEARQVEFEQKSRLFGFPDRIVVEFVTLGNGASTLAIYSRSLKGYWDFGVNRKRVERWLAALPAQIERQRDVVAADVEDV
ncbi:MAG: DUF1499 domain-containing protein [Kiloniellales bacterium]